MPTDIDLMKKLATAAIKAADTEGIMANLAANMAAKPPKEPTMGNNARAAKLTALDAQTAGIKDLKQNHPGHYWLNPIASPGTTGYGPIDSLIAKMRQPLYGGAENRERYRDLYKSQLASQSPAASDQRRSELIKMLRALKTDRKMSPATAAYMVANDKAKRETPNA